MLNQAQQNMKEDLDTVDGELRIALSSDLGRNLVTPWLDEFMETYPDVRVTSHISDSNIDFYRDSVDMALPMVHPMRPICTDLRSVMSRESSVRHPSTSITAAHPSTRIVWLHITAFFINFTTSFTMSWLCTKRKSAYR